MSLSSDTLANALQLTPERATELVSAIARVGQRHAHGWVSLSKLIDETNEPPELLKQAVSALVLAFRLTARFEPYHQSCEQPIGPIEESVTRIEDKVSNGDYPTVCRHCGDYIDGMDDIIVRVLAYVPPGGL